MSYGELFVLSSWDLLFPCKKVRKQSLGFLWVKCLLTVHFSPRVLSFLTTEVTASGTNVVQV